MIYEPNAINLARAAETIRTRGIVAFPTETVYGLGANAFSEKAVARIFQIKGRPANNPIIVHLAEAADISQVADITDPKISTWLAIASKFWPGPLSVVLPKHPSIPENVTAGRSSVAVRIPAHPIAQALIRMSECPIAAPSANPSNYVSPTTALHVEAQLGDLVDMIIDGGPCTVGIESTVLSLVHDEPTVLRHGAVTIEQLRDVFENVTDPVAEKTTEPLSPGMLPEHYAPKTPLVFLSAFDPKVTSGPYGFICFREPSHPIPAQEVRVLSASGDLEEAATRLFATLRELDSLGLSCIVVEPCPEEGIGRALMDRLRRATCGGARLRRG